ncbi:hypothetical protein [Bradyrhizobium cosmicum]|uniref:hypothetical protein n=1 Tax=Bradyrhizobium cosmicum TaxID=1404864 RepID=UPI0028ECCB08|nr:hypothetical protein [Bradyrhizobium cosmicum]
MSRQFRLERASQLDNMLIKDGAIEARRHKEGETRDEEGLFGFAAGSKRESCVGAGQDF